MALILVHAFNDANGEHFGIVESENDLQRGRAGFNLTEAEFREVLKSRYGKTDEEVQGLVEKARTKS